MEINMFVSYCQKDRIYADYMDLYFKDKNIIIHRDIRDISNWKSIKEYMNKIRDVDYAVLVITDSYLKSFNCMYEVLEVMKENNYKDKIFPVVVEHSIYSPNGKVPYIKYWEKEYKQLENQLKTVGMANHGPLQEDLKKLENIAASMSEFLGLVSDMNNPDISDVNLAIESKLREKGLLEDGNVITSKQCINADIFSSLDIPRINASTEPTDLEKSKFMSVSFKQINELLSQICNQVQSENSNIQIQIEQIDSRNVTYEFYINGNMVTALKLFFGAFFGGDNNICISSGRISLTGNSSCNGIISNKFENGKLSLYAMMSISMSQKPMTIEETVKAIWTSYVKSYLER